MNPFAVLFLPLFDFGSVVAHQNYKTRIYFSYLLKIFFTKEKPRVSRGKVPFDEIRRTTRINLDLPSNATSNKFNINFIDDDFESVNQ